MSHQLSTVELGIVRAAQMVVADQRLRVAADLNGRLVQVGQRMFDLDTVQFGIR
jgi:hypothetical protein